MSWETAAMRDGIMSGVRAQVANDQRQSQAIYDNLMAERNELVQDTKDWSRMHKKLKSEKEEVEVELEASKQHVDVLKQNLNATNSIVKKQSDVIANDVKIITDQNAALAKAYADLAKAKDVAYKESVKNIANQAVIEGFKLTVKAIDPENYILKDAKKMKVPGTEREATGYDLVYITSVAKQLISKGIDITEIGDYL